MYDYNVRGEQWIRMKARPQHASATAPSTPPPSTSPPSTYISDVESTFTVLVVYIFLSLARCHLATAPKTTSLRKRKSSFTLRRPQRRYVQNNYTYCLYIKIIFSLYRRCKMCPIPGNASASAPSTPPPSTYTSDVERTFTVLVVYMFLSLAHCHLATVTPPPPPKTITPRKRKSSATPRRHVQSNYIHILSYILFLI